MIFEYDTSYLEFSFQSDAITNAQEVESLGVQLEATMMVLKNTMQDKTSIESKDVFVSIMNGKPITSSVEKIIKVRYFAGVFWIVYVKKEATYFFSITVPSVIFEGTTKRLALKVWKRQGTKREQNN